jgi:hypothetical protein
VFVCDIKKGMDISMKKKLLYLLLLMSLLVITGCSKNVKSIEMDKVEVNTILAKANGELTVATVESFDKPHYNIEELRSFVAKEVDEYNKKAGEGKVKVDEIKQQGSKVVMLITYTGMDQYAAFNKVTAAYFNSGIDNLQLELPATLINASNESATSTKDVIQSEGYKVLVLNEPYDIYVDGKVKYYSENAKLTESNNVIGAADGTTVVVFK